MMQTLVFLIYDHDKLSKHDQIGIIELPFHSIDIGMTLREWRNIDLPQSEKKVVTN